MLTPNSKNSYFKIRRYKKERRYPEMGSVALLFIELPQIDRFVADRNLTDKLCVILQTLLRYVEVAGEGKVVFVLKNRKIPIAAIRRLPRYYRHLEALQKKGVTRISSLALGMRTGLSSSQIRQDLCRFGEFGQQGYGYNVSFLLGEIAEILGMNNRFSAIVVGAGRLAKVLAHNFPFNKYGIVVTAVYDVDPNLVGTFMNGVPIHHIDDLPIHLGEHAADIAILTVSESAAHEVSNIVTAAGVKGIWNFTNAELNPHAGNPVIENVHLFDSLFSMCCMMNGYDI